MNNKFLLLCIAAALTVCNACSEKQDTGREEETLTLKASSKGTPVTVSEDGKTAAVTFSAARSYAITEVISALEWQCSVDEDAEDWCHTEPLGGGFRITVAPNTGFSERKAIVTITYEDNAAATVAVTQKSLDAEPQLLLEKDEVAFPEAGKSVTLSVLTNMPDWDVSVPEDASWLTVTKDKSLSTLTITASENTAGADRTSALTFTGAQAGKTLLTREIPVEQWGPSLVLSVTVGSGDKVVLPFAGKDMDLSVDWGDSEDFDPTRVRGTIASISSMVDYLDYIYAESGTYDITVHGVVPIITAYLDNVLMDSKYMRKITAVKSWGKGPFQLLTSAFYNAGLKSVASDKYGALASVTDVRSIFMNCASLESIPADFFQGMKNVTDFNSAFFGCSSFKEIPAGLFSGNKQTTSFVSTFKGTGITSVPADIFSACPDVVTFESTFAECSDLETVPEQLFSHNTKVTSFNSTFSESGIKSVPAGLFASCPAVTDFSSAFYDSALESIPAGLFSANKEVLDFEFVFNRTKIQTIPADLFAGAAKATKFEAAFYRCQNLVSIPAGLLDGCVNAESLNQLFSYCSSLKTIPSGLFDKCQKVNDVDMCFKGTGINAVPSGLFDNLRNVTSLMSMFEGCEALETVPAGAFAKCTSVTDFSNIFKSCTSLKNVNGGIFPASATNMSSAFSGCSALESIPENLFSGLAKVQKFNNVFEDCSSIVSVPAGIFKDNAAVESFDYAFYNCSSLKTVGNPEDADGCIFKYAADAVSFGYVFRNCSALTGIPAHTFAFNKKGNSFQCTFDGCSSLSCESPYAEVTVTSGGVSSVKKIHLYERNSSQDVFSVPFSYSYCFDGCTSLADYDSIPDDWK